jgi:hypothetical protein
MTMQTVTPEREVQTIDITKEMRIKATPTVVFAALLEQIGPGSETPDGASLQMKLEAWPGGRWFRDLGNNAGHLWGHVQVIKPPTLLEISGPMFMSYPAISHLQYRIAADGAGSKLTLTHKAMGLIPAEHREGVGQGWEHWMQQIQMRAEGKL